MSTTTRLGVLDIGSNTVHLAVVDAQSRGGAHAACLAARRGPPSGGVPDDGPRPVRGAHPRPPAGQSQASASYATSTLDVGPSAATTVTVAVPASTDVVRVVNDW